ncbi:hypothetical protein C8R31_10322 [Nitrosospira sp. Nsp2]|nr:hypothetical protein C8R31_10322 [Nitrosospira sp. Nsp2]
MAGLTIIRVENDARVGFNSDRADLNLSYPAQSSGLALLAIFAAACIRLVTSRTLKICLR